MSYLQNSNFWTLTLCKIVLHVSEQRFIPLRRKFFFTSQWRLSKSTCLPKTEGFGLNALGLLWYSACWQFKEIRFLLLFHISQLWSALDEILPGVRETDPARCIPGCAIVSSKRETWVRRRKRAAMRCASKMSRDCTVIELRSTWQTRCMMRYNLTLRPVNVCM